MRRELIETGKTVDAAIDSACEKLGCSREDCEWEIIDLPKKALLGLKLIPAKVKVAIELPDEKPEVKLEPAPVKKEAPVHKSVQKEKEVVKSAAEPAVAEKTIAPKKPTNKKPKEAEPVIAEEQENHVLVTKDFTDKEKLTMDYIMSILREFGLEAKLSLYRDENSIYINIVGDGLGTIIGRRGETLDAIQYLAGLVANRAEGEYVRVTLDCGDYRAKRKQTLEALAKKLAAQVLKTNTSKTLEPMNPFERRVIHAAISEIEGVTSSSIGEEPNRRVVITSPTAKRPSRGGRGRGNHSGGDRDRRSSRSGGGRDRGRSRSGSRSQSVAPQDGPPKQTPEAAAFSNTPIGKLDLE